MNEPQPSQIKSNVHWQGTYLFAALVGNIMVVVLLLYGVLWSVGSQKLLTTANRYWGVAMIAFVYIVLAFLFYLFVRNDLTRRHLLSRDFRSRLYLNIAVWIVPAMYWTMIIVGYFVSR